MRPSRTPTPGLWPYPRRDPGNSARADVAGGLAEAPAEVWRYGGAGGSYGFARRVRAGGQPAFVVQRGRGLALLRPDGSTAWEHPVLGVDAVLAVADLTGAGQLQALVSLGKLGFALVAVDSGRVLWRWAAPEGAQVVRCQLLPARGGMSLFVFPPSPLAALGFCFDFADTDGTPRLRWAVDYAGRFWANYGPNLVLADMDRDGITELVVASKPAYIGVIDTDTGQVKFELHYEIEDPLGFGRPDGAHVGRPYGLLQAVDLDADGFPDLVLAATQVEEYAAVLHNEGGRGLVPAWTLFVEKDFPEDHRELRAQPTSVADVDGDGRPELVLGLYGVGGAGGWRTLVLDPLRGWRTPIATLEGRYFWGCFDVNLDGVPEVVTARADARLLLRPGLLETSGGPDVRLLASLDDAQPAARYSTITRSDPPRCPGLTYYGALVEPTYVPGGGLVVRRAADRGGEGLWRADGGRSRCEPFTAGPFARTLLWSGSAAAVDGLREPGGPIGGAAPDLPASRPGARAPLVGLAGGRRELVLSLSDSTVIGGVPDLGRTGRFRSHWRVRGQMPALWLGPAGQRWLCVADPDAEEVRLLGPAELADSELATARPAGAGCVLRLPYPLNRNPMMAGVFPRHQAGMMPFGDESMWLFVPLRLGEHRLGCCLFGPDGALQWIDSEVGPHPRLPALADLNGDGRPELVVDNHGMQYHVDLSGHRRLIAQAWGDAVPGRGDGCAHALPVVGPYGPEGQMRVVMTPGYSAIEVQAADGARLALHRFAHAYEFAGRAAAIGAVRGPGRWDLGVVCDQGVLHCFDLESLQRRWTLGVCEPTSWPVSCVSADLDGDQQDEFLIGLPDGRLIAVAERDGCGGVLWEVRFVAGVNDAIVADIDGDGQAEAIVETDDGYVRILKSPAR